MVDPPSANRLLAFARELQRAATFEELLLVAQAEVRAALGYEHAWLMVCDNEDLEELRLLDVAGARRGLAWELTPALKIKGDAMLEEIVRSDEPVVVEDARTDPRTNKQIVAQLENRTIINVPLRLLDKPFGAFGTGTFGDAEGCRPPTREQLYYLVGMAGQIAVAAGRIRFLDERKRAEAALRKSEAQLLHAQKMEAVGRLAGSVAHDFNNQLSVILSYCSFLLADLNPKDPIRQDVEAIGKAGEQAASLTRQLLAFSRQQLLEPRVLNLNAVLGEAEKMLRRLLGEDIELVTSYEPALYDVFVDPGQIDQVIMNLAVNARDAMPNGGKLTIETGSVMLDEAYSAAHIGVKPGPYAMLAMSDTGIGMDEETRAHIFEPFFTTKDQHRGTGLGLSTVFGIVKQSAGSIWVYSEPGRGTTFRIYFPRAEQTAQRDVEPSAPLTLHGNETILLVEDNPDVRRVARAILERYGYRVLEAQNPADALRASEQHPQQIHLLLTDVVMPQMSGPDLASRLVQARPTLKVLYMSGYTDNAVIHHGILEAGVAYLQKPLIPEQLGRRIREVMSGRRGSVAPAPLSS